MAVKLPLTLGQQERIGEITVLKAERAVTFMTVMYYLLTGFVSLLLIWAIILTGMVVIKATGGLSAISWQSLGTYFFGSGGFATTAWFLKPIRDHLIKANS